MFWVALGGRSPLLKETKRYIVFPFISDSIDVILFSSTQNRDYAFYPWPVLIWVASGGRPPLLSIFSSANAHFFSFSTLPGILPGSHGCFCSGLLRVGSLLFSPNMR